MKKPVLYYKCPHCGHNSRFKKTDLPAGFISPDDLNENKISLLEVECPECEQSEVITLENVRKALNNPEPELPKGKWKWFWKE